MTYLINGVAVNNRTPLNPSGYQHDSTVSKTFEIMSNDI